MGKRLLSFLAICLFAVSMAFAQKAVTGTVIDQSTGEPVVGASVIVKGTTVGVATDINGKFTISNVPNGAKTLKVSYVGMADKEVAIKNTNMRIFLASKDNMLDDVMVVAFGSTKRSTFTGSATEIKTEDITAHVASSATSALVGKVAGVTATNASGGPGSSPSIKIRGIGSYQASTSPLYIVDGAPYEASVATINPQDIASITVLKDASASAIYGARGANGVIIITTKKGQDGQDAEVTFDAKWGSNSRLIPNYDVITNPAQYYETHYKALYNSQYYNGATAAEAYAYADKNLFDQKNGGLGYQVYTVPDGERFIGTNFKLNPHAKLGYVSGDYYYTPDNWYDETFHSSFRQEYNASVSGSNGRLNYFGSVGYLDDKGFVNNSDYQRYTSRVNVDYQAKKWLKLTTSMGFTHSESETPSYDDETWGSSGNLFYICNTMAPIYPLYVRNADGSIKKENGMKVYDSNQTDFTRPSVVGNAVRDNEYDKYASYSDIFNGQWAAVISPIEGLDFTARLNAMAYNNRGTSRYSKFGSAAVDEGAVGVSHLRRFTVNQQYLANWSKTFADKHNVAILAGYEQFNELEQNLSGYNDHVFNPLGNELNNALGVDKKRARSNSDSYMTEGFLGRAQYDYAEKYFIDGSIRRDASSVFAPGHRWGTFYSVGGGWQINKESFMENATWVDLLKLKVSYGEQGNDGMSWHAYSDLYTTSWNKETGKYNAVLSSMGNEELTWETSKALNLGVDFSLFGHRLNGTIEYYRRKTVDLLFPMELSLSSGKNVRTYPVNVGDMVNTGVEIALDGTVIKAGGFQWDLNANITHNHNEITDLAKQYKEKGGIKSGNRIVTVGGSIYEAYMVKYAGVDKSNGQALYYKDVLDADGKVTGKTTTTNAQDATQYDLGTTMADVTGGFGTSLSYKGFDLSAQFSFQLGGKIYDGSYQSLMHNGYKAGFAMHKDLLNAWSPENANSNIPRLSSAAGDNTDVGSQTAVDRYLTSSNYLSLDNVSLGYSLPKSIVAPLTLHSIRVYVAAENVFLLTARKGLDPRYNYGLGSMTSGAGLNTGSYSAMRSITAGLTVKF